MRFLPLVVATVSLLFGSNPGARAFETSAGDPELITVDNGGGPNEGFYVVEPGDTLWDLSAYFYGSEWEWPTLWSYNPQITNPHWIFPGDILQIRPLDQLPTSDGGAGGTGGGPLIWSASSYGGPKPDYDVLARYVAFLPTDAFEAAGRISNARGPVKYLSQHDEVYVKPGEEGKLERGATLTIFREVGELRHPTREDEVLGKRIKVLGTARVVDVNADLNKAVIEESYQEIERGDLVTDALPASWVVSPVTNDKDLEATLVAFDAPVSSAGQFQYAFIDRGTRDGVARGNRFVIRRRGDGRWDEPPDDEDALESFPWEYAGEVMVVEPFEKASLVIIVRSVTELEPGEQLIMSRGY